MTAFNLAGAAKQYAAGAARTVASRKGGIPAGGPWAQHQQGLGAALGQRPPAPATPDPVVASADNVPDPPPTMPFDGPTERQISANQANYDTIIAGIHQRRALLDRAFGARDGHLNWTDPSDPWSRTATINRAIRESRQQLTGRQFGSGHGFDGSSEQQDQLMLRDNQATIGQADAEYQGQVAGLGQEEASAAASLGSQNADLLANLARQWAANPQAEVALPGTVASAATSTATDDKPTVTPGVSKKGVKGAWHTYKNGRRVFVPAKKKA